MILIPEDCSQTHEKKMQDVRRGMYCEGLVAMRPILSSWIVAIDSYIDFFNSNNGYKVPDVPWWYNERASISILAGAMWKTGNIAIEEYIINRANKRKGHGGRCDLFIGHGFIDGHAYACEAKQASFCIDNASPAVAKEIADNLLRSACEDARTIDKKEADTRLAICFLVPYYQQLKTSSVDKQLYRCRKEIQRTANLDFMAWNFPASAEGVSHVSQSNKRDFYPGVVLLGKKV